MEDFVSFEIAKKLKEKGFNWTCSHYYRTKSKDLFMIFPSDDWSNIEERVNAPTISQVLKWLRDKHATYIEISLGRNGWYFEIIQYEYYEEEKEYGCKLITISVIYDSYENSALAGIEYSLDNLI